MEYTEESRDRRITQLRKGILELAVIGVLIHERHYGYSLVRALSERGSISLKEGTVYPILGRLERDGVLRSEWVESEHGPPRKYYAITDSGRELFAELIKEFDLLVSLVQRKWEAPKPIRQLGKLFVRKG